MLPEFYRVLRIDLKDAALCRAVLSGNEGGTGARLSNAAIEGARNPGDSLIGVAAFVLAEGPLVLVWCAMPGIPAWFGRGIWRRRGRKAQ